MLAGSLKLRVRVGPSGGMEYVAHRLGSDRVMIDDGAHTVLLARELATLHFGEGEKWVPPLYTN